MLININQPLRPSPNEAHNYIYGWIIIKLQLSGKQSISRLEEALMRLCLVVLLFAFVASVQKGREQMANMFGYSASV